jgi:tetratricopeptide (TPR) repeat protein
VFAVLLALMLGGGARAAVAAEWPFNDLADLETKEFAAVKTGEPVPDRLEALEKRLLGNAQMGTLAVRIGNLKKAEAAKISSAVPVQGQTQQNGAVDSSKNVAMVRPWLGGAVAPSTTEEKMPGKQDDSAAAARAQKSNLIRAGVMESVLRSPMTKHVPTPKSSELSASGQAAYRAGQNDQAKKLQEEALKHDPKNSDAYYQLALMAEQKNSYGDALKNYVLAYNNDPTNPVLRAALDNLETRIKTVVKLWHSQSYYFNDPRDPRLLLNYGVRMYSVGWYPQAEDLFTKAAWLDPSNGNAFFNLGVLAERQGQPARALAMYQRAATLFKMYGDGPPPARAMIRTYMVSPGLVPQFGAASAPPSTQLPRFCGREDRGSGSDLSGEAILDATSEMHGQRPMNADTWPLLSVSPEAGPITTAGNQQWPVFNVNDMPHGYMHGFVDTCDRCRIPRDTGIGPN